MSGAAARAWALGRLVVSVAGVTAVVTQLAFVVDQGNPWTNFLSFFTIESNIAAAAVLGTAGVVGLRGGDGPETSPAWAWARGAVTTYMVVTGIVYFALLRGVDVQTSEPWINTVLHYLVPVAALFDWVVRPARTVPLRRAAGWLAFPALYLLYSLVRGPLVDWYPYPFLDPRPAGYVPVAVASTGVLVLVLVVVALLLALQRRRRAPDGTRPRGETGRGSSAGR